MSAGAAYTPYHPKWYRRRVSVWWWLKSGPFVLFVLRELTSVFVAFVSLVLLFTVKSVARGPESYERFLHRMSNPFLLGLSVLALVFVLFHTITWFNLAPKAIVVRVGGKRLPDWAVAASNYAAWVVVSAGVAALVLLRK